MDQVPPNPTPTVVATPSPSVPPPAGNQKTTLLVGISILMFLLGIGGVVFGLWTLSQTKPAPTPSPQTGQIVPTVLPTSGQEATTTLPVGESSPAATSAATKSTPPEGYVAKETLCYTIFIPKDNDAGDENNCDLNYHATIGENFLLGATVWIEQKEFTKVEEMISYRMKNVTNKISAKQTTKVGGVDGYRIIEYEKNGNEYVHIFIYLPNKYKAYGYPIYGFEISKVFEKASPGYLEDQQKTFDLLLSTWQWK